MIIGVKEYQGKDIFLMEILMIQQVDDVEIILEEDHGQRQLVELMLSI